MNDLTVLNFPITTPEAENFWGSSHLCNKFKSIIAFSLDLANANDNLRRYGYNRAWRTKSLYHYGKHVNHPAMTGIPFTEMETPYWVEMPYVSGVNLDDVIKGSIKP